MVSWLIEMSMRGDLGGASVAGGVFMSGGSYACYNTPPTATGPCADCDPTCGMQGGARRTRSASKQPAAAAASSEAKGSVDSLPSAPPPPEPCPVSTTAPGCSSCGGVNATGPKPCCGYCCPTDFAEQYFVDHPDQWHLHPPAFLVQMATYVMPHTTLAGLLLNRELLQPVVHLFHFWGWRLRS